METLAPVWACDPRDLIQKQTSVWESECVLNSSPPAAGLMWTEQLSPHLQRNKLLQDTLLQREEEMARLQDENTELRRFLNSGFVRNLEHKAKKLTTDGRMKLKRNLTYLDDSPFHHHITKKVCRNLTAEFASVSNETSETSETSPASREPNLDLWVLQTLGLKDRDTIADTSTDDTASSSAYSLSSLVYDSEYSLNSSFGSSNTSNSTSSCDQISTNLADYTCGYFNGVSSEINTSTPSAIHISTNRDEFGCGADLEKLGSNSAKTPQVQRFDFTASGLSRQYESPENVIRTFNTLPAFKYPNLPLTEELPFTSSTPNGAKNQAQNLDGNTSKHPIYWTPSRDTIRYSPPEKIANFSPIISSPSPGLTQFYTPVQTNPSSSSLDVNSLCKQVYGGLTSPLAGSKHSPKPNTPPSRTDLAFSMCLSPSSKVKTHSYPQGQAFIRKDVEGRWNFTWVPSQGP